MSIFSFLCGNYKKLNFLQNKTMQVPKRTCLELPGNSINEQVLMIALGYDELTVDKVKWTDEYAKQTCLIGRVFYKAYVDLKIVNRVVVCDHYSECDCHSTHSSQHIVKNATFHYNKATKLLIHAAFADGPSIDFVDGVPTIWHSRDGLSVNGIFETETQLVAEVQNGEIVLVDKPVTLVMDLSRGHIYAMTTIHNAGYNMVGFSGQFAKVPKMVITCGDTQIRHVSKCSLNYNRPALNVGIKKMYLVEHFHDTYRVGCADSNGTHIFLRDGAKAFLLNNCNVCWVRYVLSDMWDFSSPIPRKYVVTSHTCKLHPHLVEKN